MFHEIVLGMFRSYGARVRIAVRKATCRAPSNPAGYSDAMLKKKCPRRPAMRAHAAQTAHRLPWAALAAEIAALLRDASVRVPARMVPLPAAQAAS